MLAIADQLGEAAGQTLLELIDFFSEQSDWGLSVSAAEQLVAATPKPALTERTRYVDLLGRSGQAVAQLQHGKDLIADLLKQQQRSEAIDLLESLVESHDEQVDLRRQLAELLVFAERGNEAVRHFRSCIPIARSWAVGRGRRCLDAPARCSGRQSRNRRAAELLAAGTPINWQSIRDDLTAQQVEKLEREGAEGSTRRRTDAVQVQDDSSVEVAEDILEIDDSDS